MTFLTSPLPPKNPEKMCVKFSTMCSLLYFFKKNNFLIILLEFIVFLLPNQIHQTKGGAKKRVITLCTS